jgi:hypothetical protein
MIIVVSNRQVNEGATDETLFGETPNNNGIDELRLAKANYDPTTNQWAVELLPETGLQEGVIPSQQLFNEIMAGIQAGLYRKTWIFYVHGFNQSFAQTLIDSQRISDAYDADIILFSWPSNPGGFVTDEYRRARQAAKASANALDRTFDKLGSYLVNRPFEEIQQCRITLNLLLHSLGNFIMESVVRDPIFMGNIRLFENIIFHQADIDNRLHYLWMDGIDYSSRIYVTINEQDVVLKASDVINPGRLGNTLEALNGERPVYMDFTEGRNVGGAHNLFLEVENNASVTEFFNRVLTGRRGEVVPGFTYDDRVNAFRLRT